MSATVLHFPAAHAASCGDVIALIAADDLEAVKRWVACNDVNRVMTYRFGDSALDDDLDNATAFNIAICMRREQIALWLLRNGARQNVPTYRTNALYVSETEIHPLLSAIDLNMPELAREMIRRGVDLNYRQRRWHEDMAEVCHEDPPLGNLLKERADTVIPFMRRAQAAGFLRHILETDFV